MAAAGLSTTLAACLPPLWLFLFWLQVKTLFAVAGVMQPSVIFIDEIDSILSARKSEGEQQPTLFASRALAFRGFCLLGAPTSAVVCWLPVPMTACDVPSGSDGQAMHAHPAYLQQPACCTSSVHCL